MADYISRQEAIDRFENLSYADWNQGASTTWANAFSECADMIRELPSEYVVEVVRCADCKYFDSGTDEDGKLFFKCLGWVYGGTSEDDFCSHGERNDG